MKTLPKEQAMNRPLNYSKHLIRLGVFTLALASSPLTALPVSQTIYANDTAEESLEYQPIEGV